MIKVTNLYKSFDGFQALTALDIHVRKGSIYGLVGVNGSGKTTLIKHLTGVLIPDAGEVRFDGEQIFENASLKGRIGFIPDDLFFYSSYSLKDCARFYHSIYPRWDRQRYRQMVEKFGLNERRRLSKFSKGMQKQASFILVMSAMPDFLVLDEPIDGLDPIVRKLVWKYIVEDVAERDMTVLVSSHNLREMEGICDSIGILQKGRIAIERDLDELKTDIHKIQVAYASRPEKPYEGLNVLHMESRGSMDMLIIRNKKELVEERVGRHQPAVFDMLPLTLEEIFIYEIGGGKDEIQSIL